MSLILVFLLGIANFAMHRAVLESGHPMVRQMAPFTRALGGRVSFALEFVLLVAAMLLVVNDRPGWGLGYLAYSGMNGFAAWLILSRRI